MVFPKEFLKMLILKKNQQTTKLPSMQRVKELERFINRLAGGFSSAFVLGFLVRF